MFPSHTNGEDAEEAFPEGKLTRVAIVQHLRQEVQVADEGGLEDDGHVRCVKQLDGKLPLLTAILGISHWQVDSPP